MSDIERAIQVESVSKQFKLPHEKNTTIKSAFTSIGKTFGGKKITRQQALKDVSFDVEKGEFFGIVGRNGSGKSTLLKILAGIYQPTRGSVVTHGKLVPFIELGVGFNPELTGRENVYLNGALLGFSRKEIDKRYKDIVRFAELGRFMDQKLKNYSSGMQVRLAFSVAIQADADILLIDEVLAVGDESFKRKCYDYFRNLKKNNTTVIFVSHDMEAVKQFCTKAVLIGDGGVVKEGEPQEVADEYSKMFIENVSESGATDSARRWGDGAATFSKAKASRKNGQISIEAEVSSKTNIEDVSVGFVLHDPVGNQLLGTNNVIADKQIKQIKKGSKRKIIYEFPDVLAEGTYTVELGVSYQNGIIAERWPEACTIQIAKQKKTNYVIGPDIEVIISE